MVEHAVKPGPPGRQYSSEKLREGSIAFTLGLKIGGEVCVTARRESVTAKALLDDRLSRGTIFMPFCYAEAAASVLAH